MAIAYAMTQRFEKALAAQREYLEITQRDAAVDPGLAFIYATAGRVREARQILELIERTGTDLPARMGAAYGALGGKDKAFKWLDRAYTEHAWHISFIRAYPTFDSLRNDPRFQSLRRRMNFPE